MPQQEMSVLVALLKTLGIRSLCEWDVLIFLYRHRNSLVGAEYLASLLGYVESAVIPALENLESLGLVRRSRVNQNVRMYESTVPSNPTVRQAFGRLATIGNDRTCRLQIADLLRSRQGEGKNSQVLCAEKPRVRPKFQEPEQQQRERSELWPIAISL